MTTDFGAETPDSRGRPAPTHKGSLRRAFVISGVVAQFGRRAQSSTGLRTRVQFPPRRQEHGIQHK
jgi:hypothetical protein